MQPQEQTSVLAMASSWVSTEISSILQLLFFLSLGYAVTRSWIFTRARTAKVLVKTKKLDDDNEVEQVAEETQPSESDASPSSSKSKSKSSHQRRKNKKASNASSVEEVEQLQHEAEPVAPAPAPEQVTPAEEPQEVQQPEEQPIPEACSEPVQVEAAVEQPQEAPQEVTQEAPQEQAESAPRKRMSDEQAAKMMAKKMERKAKKALEKKAQEEQMIEEESSPLVAGGSVEESDIVALVEAKSEAEVQSDDMAQTASTPSMSTSAYAQNALNTVENIAIVHETPAVSITTVQEGTVEMEKPIQRSDPLENIETDAVSESDEHCVHSSAHEGISTPEQCLSPRGPAGDPLVWCGVPQVPQIEGWMAVAVPAEFAPPGAPGPFDGLYENTDAERIVVDHEQIEFDSGMIWVLEMKSLTEIAVKVGDEEFTAVYDPAEQNLTWSDGDVWKCVGQTDGQQRWAAQREAEGMPPMLFEGETMMMPMVMEAPLPLPQNMMVPQDAKSWETCWDWSKKGWCPRGDACEWYHPPCQQPRQFGNGTCKPCEQAPFSEFMDVPFGGPVF